MNVSAAAPADQVAVVLGETPLHGAGQGLRQAGILSSGRWWTGPQSELGAALADVMRDGSARIVVWRSADLTVPVSQGARLHRLHDIAEAHRVLHGGWRADAGVAWAAARGLSADGAAPAPTNDLFSLPDDSPDLVRPDGHLRGDAVHAQWVSTPDRLHAWAVAALEVAAAQVTQARRWGPRVVATVNAESAAALLCVELARDGLPIDRGTMTGLIAACAGPRPVDEADAARIRAGRDASVLSLVPGWEHVDLRNPVRVKELLASTGIDVPSTRKWVLEPFRHVHPVVEALLDWRRDERIATTYGYRWLDLNVGADDRLRGTWTACDGAGGRMTADNGLHNLPAPLRPGVAAAADHAFVRADLGQIEPRVLAVVSGDPNLAAATRADDLYAPVAQRLQVDRAVAKVAVLAAMYGQRSGAAGEALKGLERAYPVAMGHLDAAYAAGVRGADLRTFGGRLIHTGTFLRDQPLGADPALDAARGRFARNAIIQGAAAELFKAWAATVRATTHDLGAQIVLCLHDELLVHTPIEQAEEVRARVEDSLEAAARRWTQGAPVRFVAETSVIHRWSEAKP